MKVLKRIIIITFAVLTFVCIASMIVLALLDEVDLVLVSLTFSIPCCILFCITEFLWGKETFYDAPEPASKEGRSILITNTRCSGCGAPLKDDTCEFCGKKAIIYKKI